MNPDSSRWPGGLAQYLDRAVRQLAVQNRVLESLAYGEELPVVLETLVLGAESLSPGMLGSILLFDPEDQTLKDSVAPSLPEAYNAAIAVVPVGPSSGSCGTAAYRRERVVVSDIATDPLWGSIAHLALPHGLRACWSTPRRTARSSMLTRFPRAGA